MHSDKNVSVNVCEERGASGMCASVLSAHRRTVLWGAGHFVWF